METTVNTLEVTAREYAESISRLAKGRSEFVFPSFNDAHAAIIIANIIRISKKVRIYDQSLSGDIANSDNDFYKTLETFLDNGRSLSLVVRDGDEKDQKISEFLKKQMDKGAKLDVRVASDLFKQSVKDEFTYDINFAVGDKSAYRMETTGMIQGYREALSSFNDPKQASKLASIFDKNIKTCPILTLR